MRKKHYDHVAIMRKSWGLTKKIVSGEKTIESRWYVNRYKPWDNIVSGDTIYFKDSGDPVTVKAKVDHVLQFSDLTPEKVTKLLRKFAKPDGLGLEPKNLKRYYEMFRDKKYCIIIYLKEAGKVKPFNINKTGFGAMSAWLTVDHIDQIKIRD